MILLYDRESSGWRSSIMSNPWLQEFCTIFQCLRFKYTKNRPKHSEKEKDTQNYRKPLRKIFELKPLFHSEKMCMHVNMFDKYWMYINIESFSIDWIESQFTFYAFERRHRGVKWCGLIFLISTCHLWRFFPFFMHHHYCWDAFVWVEIETMFKQLIVIAVSLLSDLKNLNMKFPFVSKYFLILILYFN